MVDGLCYDMMFSARLLLFLPLQCNDEQLSSDRNHFFFVIELPNDNNNLIINDAMLLNNNRRYSYWLWEQVYGGNNNNSYYLPGILDSVVKVKKVVRFVINNHMVPWCCIRVECIHHHTERLGYSILARFFNWP